VERLSNITVAELPFSDAALTLTVMIVLGFLYCFVGYRAFHFCIAVTGFFLAGSVGAVLAGWLGEGRLAYVAVGMALGGLAGALALWFLYHAGVFFLGLLGGTIMAHYALMGRSEAWVLWAFLGAGLAGGLLALVLERPVVVMATAAIGAWLIVQGALLAPDVVDLGAVKQWLEGPEHQGEAFFGVLASWAILAATGTVIQLAGPKPKAEQ
jgi:hypothetical protein